MEQGTFQEHLLRFETSFPLGHEVLQLFKAAGARPIWVSPVRAGKPPPNSWALHVRLPRHLESHFGLNREFLVYCANTDDLQTQETTRLKGLIRQAKHPIETDFAMLIASDVHIEEKLEDWATERALGVTIVPVSGAALEQLVTGAHPDGALREVLEIWISAQNLYDERGPVTGERFYGRNTLLRDLERRLAKGGTHIGVFGLRRIARPVWYWSSPSG